jgi:hypothetical protein
MVKQFNLDPGYVTIPEANRIVLRILKVFNKDDKSHYNKILDAAKKGIFSGKKYGSRMYQVRRDDIIQYAEETLRSEQLDLFNLEIVSDKDKIGKLGNLTDIDQNTGGKLYFYLKSLRFHGIISQDTFQKSEKNIILRLNMGKINNS